MKTDKQTEHVIFQVLEVKERKKNRTGKKDIKNERKHNTENERREATTKAMRKHKKRGRDNKLCYAKVYETESCQQQDVCVAR